jgi:hypothetical protein
MYELNEEYMQQLEVLAGEIQESELLQQYLEEEEEEFFLQLKDAYEPRIAEVYEQVAKDNPLQLIAIELVLLDNAFEGLFLPKILGHAVLRGEVDKNCKYVRPQEHFKEVLLAICNSANFDIIKKRIGQSIQIGFALSSDIWVTNLINSIENKRIRHYLTSQKLERYRRDNERKVGYDRYVRQFRNEVYQTADFPDTVANLKVYYNSLRDFLLYRVTRQADSNASLIAPMNALVANEALYGEDEMLYLMAIYGAFFNLSDEEAANLKAKFSKVRANVFEADEKVLAFLLSLAEHGVDLQPEADRRLSAIVDKTQKDQLSEYFTLVDFIHDRGYINTEVHEAIQEAYNRHEGLSQFNEGVRRTIFRYFARFIQNLEERDYPEFFEISKVYTIYIGLFGNQQFNQDIEDLSMNYVRKLLARYTDKRGKDYQDIKKFVSTAFQNLDFLEEKEVVELFKTRRKRKTDE